MFDDFVELLIELCVDRLSCLQRIELEKPFVKWPKQLVDFGCEGKDILVEICRSWALAQEVADCFGAVSSS